MTRISCCITVLLFLVGGITIPGQAREERRIFGAGVMWSDWFAPSQLPPAYQANPRGFDQAQMQLIKNMGGQVTSGTFDWISVEPTQGVFDWTRGDQRTADAIAAGLTVYAYIGNTPDWAHPSNSLPGYRTPPDEEYADEFAAYCTAVAARYAGQVDHFCFWNEPNGCSWVNSGCSNSDGYPLYTHWLKRAYVALKAGNPNCVVGAAALDYNEGVTQGYRYIEGMYQEGAKGYFDAIAIHPYSAAGVYWQAIFDTRATMVFYGDADKDIWINEYGWSNADSPDAPTKLTTFLNELKKPEYEYVTMCEYLVVSDLYADSVSYGLCSHQLTPRPIYAAYQSLNKTLPPTYTPTPTQDPAAPTATPPPAGTNLVLNPGAETGDFTGWVRGGGGLTNPRIDPDAHVPVPWHHTGQHHFGIAVGWAQIECWQYQEINVVPGRTYEVGFWVAKGDGTDELVDLRWIDGLWDSAPQQTLYGSGTAAIPQWTEFSGQQITPTTSVITLVIHYSHIWATNIAGIHVDDIWLREVVTTTDTPTSTATANSTATVTAPALASPTNTPLCAVPPPGDANGDCRVDELDLMILMQQWGQVNNETSYALPPQD